MELALIPKINRLFRLQFEQVQDCFVLLYPEGMVKLNHSAGEILSCVDGSLTISQITQQLEQKYPQATSLEADVKSFLATAIEKKWIYFD